MNANQTSYHANWNYPTNIRFGIDRIKELPDVMKELQCKRPLLVSDSHLAKLAMVSDTIAIVQQKGWYIGLFQNIDKNPTAENIEQGTEVFKSGGHDSVIAFGGGSVLDAGKAIGLMVGQSRPLWDFEDKEDWYKRVDVAGMVPVIAIPTTSGTGSEVGRASVILDTEARQKKIIFHPKMLPRRVICDPKLTLSMPPSLTAAVGMDALSHNLEAYFSPFFHPQADGIALEGIRLVKESLNPAFQKWDNLEARTKMLAASMMGATAFQKGLGAMHSVAHAIGGLYNVHHGLAVAVMMPYVLKFNQTAIRQKCERLSKYLGLAEANFDVFFGWISDLHGSLNIPRSLVELVKDKIDLEKVITLAVADPTAGTNPVPLDITNLNQLVEQAATH